MIELIRNPRPVCIFCEDEDSIFFLRGRGFSNSDRFFFFWANWKSTGKWWLEKQMRKDVLRSIIM
jgi:hypothetical protein